MTQPPGSTPSSGYDALTPLPARERRWWVVSATKIPEADRDVAHAVLTEDTFFDMIGADTADDDPQHPVGSHVMYAALLDDVWAARFRASPNARFVVPDDHTLQRVGMVDDPLITNDPMPAPRHLEDAPA